MSATPGTPSPATFVIGHRGSPRRALENTLESFDRAEAEGADGFELDVRLTLDGEAVVYHDAEVVSSGRNVPLGSLTAIDAAALRVVKGEHAGAIPTLRDVLARFGGAVTWLVEMKTGPAPKPGLLEFRVAALLSQLHLLTKTTVLSFSPDLLRRIKEIQPDVATCLNFDATTYRPAGRLWPDLPKGCAAIAPHVNLASDALLAAAKEAGLAVHVWTVNDPIDAARLATLGAASVITDLPAEVGPAVRAVTGRKSFVEAKDTR